MVNPIPPFPRHLSPTQRASEFKRACALLADQAIGESPKAIDRARLMEGMVGIVHTSWTADRIADLESRVEHMGLQMAALESQPAPAPAPAKRATLKLKGGTNG